MGQRVNSHFEFLQTFYRLAYSCLATMLTLKKIYTLKENYALVPRLSTSNGKTLWVKSVILKMYRAGRSVYADGGGSL